MPIILTVVSEEGKECINLGIRIAALWDVTPRNLVIRRRPLGRKCSLHLQGWNVILL